MAEGRRKIQWSKLYSFCICSSRQDSGGEQIGRRGFSRVVFCNNPGNAEAAQLRYSGNYVSTTKYTAMNFLPKALFEQFQRVASIYFLVAALVSISPLAPYSAVSVLVPLALVIGATLGKEAIEDWRRRKQDVEANDRSVRVYSGLSFEETRWKNLRVGDIVRVQKDEFFPADLLLLSSSYEDGICYVETMNLDGETNLKVKHSLEATSYLRDENSLRRFEAVIRCEDPNENLYSFRGTLYYHDREHSLSLQQFLLRESKLKNTDYIYGVVIFTGHDTKVMKNATVPLPKRSFIEQRMDKIIYILFTTLVLISLNIGSSFFQYITGKDLENGLRRWYLRPDDTSSLYDPRNLNKAVLYHFLTALMLYGYLIPISLYVSIEIVKVLQSRFINCDQQMYDEETDRPARAHTSNLNEELGQVHTILSDKTGTLTCNSMDFVKCFVAGTAYGCGMTEVDEIAESRRFKGFNFKDERIMRGKWVNEPHSDIVQKFFRVLAVCHTAIPDRSKESGEVTYEAESPDEAAFVVASRELGFEFFDRTQTSIHVHELDYNSGEKVDRVYELLHVLEFSSSRKRMSVIVRNMENEVLLLCKGADSVMFERLGENGRQFEAATKQQINEYAEAGLRTLVIAYRALDRDEYKTWEEEFVKAKACVSEERDALVEQAADKIEKGLVLLGATAVEDKLQKGVPDCISKLLDAKINIWLLTGDKMETAINIGYACRLLRRDIEQIVISLEVPDIIAMEKQRDIEAVAKASLECIKKQLREATSKVHLASREASSESKAAFVLIIDGKPLEYLLEKNLQNSFFELAKNCSSVICCRSTPKQKALVTKMVKEKTGKITLAVGDGANDVGMIQEADIGIGISGVEGMQAAMASDISIAQFRFLERLLLVHGHWCYRRISKMICYFFYKNIVFGFTLFWFEASSSFSGKAAYNDWYLSLYNVLFTSLPSVYLIRIFPPESVSRILGWLLNGVMSSIIIFFFIANSLHRTFRSDGQTVDFEIFSVTMYTSVVWTVNCQMALTIINYFTWIHHCVIWGSIALWYIFVVAYSEISPRASTSYKVFVEACAPSPSYWLVTVLVVVSALLPYLGYRTFQALYLPMYHDLIQQNRIQPARQTDNADESGLSLPSQRARTDRSLRPGELIDGSE